VVATLAVACSTLPTPVLSPNASPTVSAYVMNVEDVDGPPVELVIGQQVVARVPCSGYTQVVEGVGGVPRLPWSLDVRRQDGSLLQHFDVEQGPEWAMLLLRGDTVALGQFAADGPAASPGACARWGPSALATPPASPAPSVPSSPAAVTGAWRGLRWSTPSVFSDAAFIATIVLFKGGLTAAGQRPGVDGSGQVAFWRSTDGTTWTPLSGGQVTFADAQVNSVVATPSGLVAWGTLGQPACTGQGEGQVTCAPTPVMLWTSPDGSNWARITDTSMFAGATIQTITGGPHGLVAVGDTGWDHPAIWVSDSGATWRRLVLPSAVFAAAHFSDVRASAAGYVLAGGTGTQQASVTGGPLSTVTVVAAGWWSPDGRTWTKATVQRPDGTGSNLGLL
jgi:hypothetical protein